MSTKHGARISIRDLVSLNEASEALAAVAEQIKRANPSWAPTSVSLLIQVNTRILALQTKGAAAYARYLQKHPGERPRAEAEIAAIAAELEPVPDAAANDPLE